MEKPISLKGIPLEVLLNYYNHQYERMAKLEDQRTAITNFTITLSVLAFTFGFDPAKGFTKTIGFGLLIVMATANIFAILYILRTKSWIKTHKMRADGMLEQRFKKLLTFNDETHAKHSNWSISRWKIQMLLHILLLIVAIVMTVFLLITPVI